MTEDSIRELAAEVVRQSRIAGCPLECREAYVAGVLREISATSPRGTADEPVCGEFYDGPPKHPAEFVATKIGDGWSNLGYYSGGWWLPRGVKIKPHVFEKITAHLYLTPPKIERRLEWEKQKGAMENTEWRATAGQHDYIVRPRLSEDSVRWHALRNFRIEGDNYRGHRKDWESGEGYSSPEAAMAACEEHYAKQG